MGTKEKEPLLNERIRDKEVRVIAEDGQLGVMSAQEALQEAQARGLDLVKINPEANPPVVKIMDYGKYRFDKAKREKEARKKQKTIEVKEIRLSLKIDVHDFDTKVNQAKKFIKQGNKVKVSLRFRGREMAHNELGAVNMERFAAALAEVATVDKKPIFEGRQMIMNLSPKIEKNIGRKKDAKD
ncbi:MAG: translation initiation factor IF-3 [Candidatus Fimenecus sp.]